MARKPKKILKILKRARLEPIASSAGKPDYTLRYRQRDGTLTDTYIDITLVKNDIHKIYFEGVAFSFDRFYYRDNKLIFQREGIIYTELRIPWKP